MQITSCNKITQKTDYSRLLLGLCEHSQGIRYKRITKYIFVCVCSYCVKGFRMSRNTTDVRKYFFCHRIVKVWNKLPIDTDFSSIDLFQRALDGFNFTAYCDI